jgi:NAD(P)-dependent dehydrogenase (short-subunit alcohol dehydrogenase family)
VAIVTGANHGIGAATSRALAARGVRVLVAGLPIEEEHDPATPDAYYEGRLRDPETVASAIRDAGHRAEAIALDLTLDDAPSRLYDRAEAVFEAPVRILVHNATGWVADSFRGAGADHLERTVKPVTTATFDQQFAAPSDEASSDSGISVESGGGLSTGASDRELATATRVVLNGAVQGVPAAAAQVMTLWRRGFHEDHQPLGRDDRGHRVDARGPIPIHGGQVGDA